MDSRSTHQLKVPLTILSLSRLFSIFVFAVTILLFGTTNAVAQQSNLSCSPTFVPFINGSTPVFTVTQSTTTAGTSTWLNAARTIDADTTNFATGTVGLTGALSLRVTDNANTYASGNFAGFRLASSLINQSTLGSLEIRIYLNGIQQEAVVGNNLNASSASISGAYDVGFYTNVPFNAVELRISNTLGTGSYFVYHAILRGTGSCISPALACNTLTEPGFPTYAVVLDLARTGVTGLSQAALTNTGNVVDNDPATYATLTTTTAVLGTASVAVKDVTTDYPSGTFAGYDIQNATLLDPRQWGNITVNTYRDGILKQSRSGTGLSFSGTILATSGRQAVGFVADSAFDEIQLAITQPALVSLGTTRIYSSVFRKSCAGPALASGVGTRIIESNRPASIAAATTGFSGASCVACSMMGLGNLIDADSTTAATVVLTAGVLTNGQVAIADAVTDYVPGTFAGYDVANAALLSPGALSNVSLGFYRDGVLRQTLSGNSLRLVTVPGGAADRRIVGASSDSTFDQVQFSLNQASGGTNFGTTTIYGLVLAPVGTRLALRLLSFTAQVAAKGNRLSWQVADQELGTSYTVERSADGNGFIGVDKLISQENVMVYNWLDAQPMDGTTYYRLKIQQAGGSISYSKIATIRSISVGSSNDVTVSPVPATNTLHISNTALTLIGTEALVYNPQGQVMYRFKLDLEQTVDISSWATGVYMLHMADGQVIRLQKQ